MKHFVIALTFLALATSNAQAADSCKAQSDAKKLSGAAQTSFMKKCETDAQAACDKQAADKKLSGAAKDSFTKKCVKDATGA
jgi:opacity protein-like surface antigen